MFALRAGRESLHRHPSGRKTACGRPRDPALGGSGCGAASLLRRELERKRFKASADALRETPELRTGLPCLQVDPGGLAGSRANCGVAALVI
ncbi:hypothetical protein H920_06926 [Fukomys damarensis]|uniref:Uncharacterized protein n=1 Tax=Fukomys damarensis TaxID=885580 RepID=A0A091DKZ4_FUKDA|nr:hypothetical protein H920_06926 [Fukomys damarensis]